jgi:hypothetical protein
MGEFMADALTIEDLKARHEKLYDRALQEGPELRRALTASAKVSTGPGESPPAEGNGSRGFVSEVEDLVKNVTKYSPSQ